MLRARCQPRMLRLNNPELTDRELEVLKLVAQGLSNSEISSALTITESTVKSNINRILQRFSFG